MKRAILTAAMIALAPPALLAIPALAETATTHAPFLTEQPAKEWRMNNYIGKPVVNSAGEHVGDINDVLFGKDGRISTVVLSVGGFLGMGSKIVAVPYPVVTYSEKDGGRVIMVPLTKEALKSAPDYKLTEKTTMDKVRDKAGEIAEKAGEKASELKEEAAKKIDEYKKPAN